MRRDQFEHVIRAAAEVVEDEIVVVGSQAVLGLYPEAPEPLLTSLEVDMFPRTRPERAAEIDRAIGDGSPFHETWGYYAHGVGPETAIAPAGWEQRLIKMELPPISRKLETVVAWCLEPHDLVLAKLAAGRPQDRLYTLEAIQAGLVDPERLRLGIALMPESHREPTRTRLEGALAEAARAG
ncbi:MAG: DUF6036 family nucleotidyltransferase [Gaiellaceae bacterium]